MMPSRDDPRAGRDRVDATRRARRFLARVEAHLPTLPNGARRRAFLEGQLSGWEHRYARFLASEGRSEPGGGADPPHAADFLLTITALAARRIALGERGHGGGDV
jgi:hypothetical protein